MSQDHEEPENEMIKCNNRHNNCVAGIMTVVKNKKENHVLLEYPNDRWCTYRVSSNDPQPLSPISFQGVHSCNKGRWRCHHAE